MKLSLGIPLEKLKEISKAKVDEAADALRTQFMAIHSSQALIHGLKKQEAEAVLANEDISEYLTPYITAEAEQFKTSRFSVAMDIITADNQATQASVAVERIRLAAKKRISAAKTPMQVYKALEVDWSDVNSYLSDTNEDLP